MPVIAARRKTFLSGYLRYPRKRISRVLWYVLALLIVYNTVSKLRASHLQTYSGEFQEYITHEQRVAWLKEVQAHQQRAPPVVKVTIYDVCPRTCRATNSSSDLTRVAGMDVERMDVDAGSVSLDDAPIPIIGTDEVHRRVVSGWDVALFMAHVRVWRRVFHGDGGAGIFLSCLVGDALPVLNALRVDRWFRNATEGGTMGEDGWDVLLLGAGRDAAVPTGPVRGRAVVQKQVAEQDLLAYAVSQQGADRLLRHVRAFTVGITELMSVVVDKDVKMLRWDGAGVGSVERCESDKGAVRKSTAFPFYPPVHWLHAAARNLGS